MAGPGTGAESLPLALQENYLGSKGTLGGEMGLKNLLFQGKEPFAHVKLIKGNFTNVRHCPDWSCSPCPNAQGIMGLT